MRPQLGEQPIELVIRDRPWNPGHDLGPVAAAALPGKRIHRVVMRPRPAASTGTGQRKRVEHRPGARFQVKVVEATQHALTMRHRYRSIPVAVRGLARSHSPPIRPGRRV